MYSKQEGYMWAENIPHMVSSYYLSHLGKSQES